MIQISIIIPIYNAEKYINRCIDSLIEQEFKEIEIIVVDDGSTDSSMYRLREYTDRDSRIKVVSQENKGAGAARNKGLSIATGKYIHFLDVDDWITKDLYKIVYQVAEKEKSEIVIFNYSVLDIQTNAIEEIDVFKSKVISGNLYTCDFYKMPRFFINSDVVPWNKLYRRSFIISSMVNFDEIKCANDRAFYYKTIMKAKKITLLPQMFMIYRIGNIGSLIGNKRLREFECHFKSCTSTMMEAKNQPLRIQNLLFDTAIEDMFHFYNKAGGLQQYTILVQIKEFFSKIYHEHYDWVMGSRFKNKILYVLRLNVHGYVYEELEEVNRRVECDKAMNNTTINKVITIYELITQNGLHSVIRYLWLKMKR